MTNYIYAYTHTSAEESWTRPGGEFGDFRIKVGKTKHPGEQRIRDQLVTAFPHLEGVTILFHSEPAQLPDGTDFGDKDVHRILKNAGIKNTGGEWFEATLDEVRGAIVSLQKAIPFSPTRTQSFGMRDEQRDAVERTANYFRENAGKAPRYLWNAKMRFGKTFTTYQLALEMAWKRVLVLTYKPAVQSAWKTDLLSHTDFVDWRFVDRGTSVAEADALVSGKDPVVWFASFQDLLGTDIEGKIKKHNKTIHRTNWDCIVIDEFHFGAWNDAARELYDPTDKKLMEAEAPAVDDLITDQDLGLKTKHHLHLSGTPFRAITNGEYIEDQVFNWTYIEEQRSKAAWDASRGANMYADLPQMQMYTYAMGAQAEEWADDGEFNGFSLNEYFKATKQGTESVFADPDRVAEFLQMIRGKKQLKQQIEEGNKPPFPYEAARFSGAVKHAVWYMNDVASCQAMAALLRTDPYFSTFEIHVAAGTGRGVGTGAAALAPVQDAIKRAEKDGKSGSITLSCGKLMTGVTVPEWSSIFMLRSLKSPESYFQAAFRVQSPWRHEGEIRKHTCYVFEFDPNRALSLVALYGTELANNDPTHQATQRDVLGELINYLPIFAIDGGSFDRLDTDAVLDWANAGVSANSLARKWSSFQLFDLNAITMGRLLDDSDLLEELEQIEDFQTIRTIAEKMVTSSEKLKQAKREKKPQEESEHRKSVNEQRKSIREKLKKISAKVLVFMYLTDFREEMLDHVIDSLDEDLFLRTTGLTLTAFKKLNREVQVFNVAQMEDAIRKFRYFEQKSLEAAR